MSKESALHNNNWCTETKLTNTDLANAMDEYAEEVCIGFGTWYSGMDEQKVKRAFQKYKQEKLCNPSPKI